MDNLTVADLDRVLTGQLSGYGATFYEVGHKYGIDPREQQNTQ
ncbi:hypothetical protein [Bacillus sp. JJ722]